MLSLLTILLRHQRSVTQGNKLMLYIDLQNFEKFIPTFISKHYV